jgi:lysozyme
MMLSDDGLRFIAGFEGYHESLPDGRCRAYRCVVGRDKKGRPIHDGKWTIGFGCTEGVTEGLIWTREEAEQAFREELTRFEAAVNRLVKVPISANAYDALVSFAYNCGEGALSKSNLLKKLNKGDHAGAAREFGNWVNSNGVKNVPGLVRRRAEEKAMFLRPDAPVKSKGKAAPVAPVPSMPQSVEAPAPVAQTLQRSRTLSGILATALGGVVYVFQETVQVFLAAASQIEMLAPVGSVLSGIGVPIAKVGIVLATAGLSYAAFARFHAAVTGKVG